jgi:hypothetical protein
MDESTIFYCLQVLRIDTNLIKLVLVLKGLLLITQVDYLEWDEMNLNFM